MSIFGKSGKNGWGNAKNSRVNSTMNSKMDSAKAGTSSNQSRLVGSRFHFVGVGGIGMCGLAELLHNMGATVTGSDLHENAQTLNLQKMGVTVKIGHSESNFDANLVDVIVYSSAIRADNVELQLAKKFHIPVIPRAEALGEVMRLKRGIAVGGTHGKTTTTSMIASVFIHALQDPTVVVGGRLDLIKSTARLGTGEWIIAEADESDGSFSYLKPEIAIITNIDDDHMDHYKTKEALEDSFLSFARSVPFYGAAIVCGDDDRILKTFSKFNKPWMRYGFGSENDFVLRKEKSKYFVMESAGSGAAKEAPLGEFSLQVPGDHNALNAMAAVLAGVRSGLSWEESCRGVSEYQGVDRRFQAKGKRNSALLFDDYAHHPTEIRATLKAAKEKFSDKEIIAIFQPHRYSRTQLCWPEFIKCFSDADRLYLLDIYPAGEKALPDVTSLNLANAINATKSTDVEYIADRLQLIAHLKSTLSDKQVLLTLGAGDVWKIANELNQDL